MENFIVSARKYRPDTFASVVGQEAIVRTLKNSIRNNQLAQAFLFTGPRGVGKTTTARIMAKTINCQNITENFEACNECDSCIAFNDNASFNVHELDAASNNSVDDIRNLVEQVRIPPQAGKYKVYIIDEVHMLSQAAFNAFLKTLEEPPPYAKFILATTEKHKIIPTILSRCQIYDFKRISVGDIAKHLEYIAKNESVEAEEDALHIIAQKADGALRDALSLFDQIVSFSGNKVTYLNVIENLNVLDYEYYFRLIDAILQKDVAQTLLIINEIIDNGFDGYHFIGGFGSHLRDLLVSQDTQTIDLLEVGKSVKQRYLEQASQAPTSFLLKALEINNTFDLNFKASHNKTLHLELDLLQMISIVGSPIETKSRVQIPSKEESIANTTKVSPSQKKAEKKAEEPHTEAPKTEASKQTNIETNKPPSPIVEVKNTKEEKLAEEKQNITSEKIKADEVSNKTAIKKTRSQIPDVLSMGFKKPTAKVEKKIENHVVRDKEVNKELVQNELNLFAQDNKDNDMLFTALTAYPIEFNNNKILLTVDNKFQANQIFQNKQTILEFLDKKLNNNILRIDTQISKEEGAIDKRAYSEADKLKELQKMNPELDNFIGQLKLKLDE